MYLFFKKADQYNSEMGPGYALRSDSDLVWV